MTNLTLRFSALLLVGLVVGAAGCTGGEDHPHDHDHDPVHTGSDHDGHGHDDHDHSHGDGGELPPTAAALWLEITSLVEKLDTAVQAGRLGEVPAAGFRVAELVRALPERSPGLEDRETRMLIGFVGRVGDHVEALHRYAEDGFATKTAKELERLTERLGYMRELYPADTGSPRAHDHSNPPHGGAVGMAGDTHLELVVDRDGGFRLYILDAYLRPVSAKGVSGTVEAGDRHAGLVVGPQGKFLTAAELSLAPDETELTVDLVVGAQAITMTLPVIGRVPSLDRDVRPGPRGASSHKGGNHSYNHKH